MVLCVSWNPSYAQTDWIRVLSGTMKVGQAMAITDEELANIVHEQVVAMDNANSVCGQDSKYTKRLNKLTKGMTDADGIKLNFKVYQTTEYNAFACPDGSVRVFSALMDILNDNELLGVIGHQTQSHLKAGHGPHCLILHWEVLQVWLYMPNIHAIMKHRLTIMVIAF